MPSDNLSRPGGVRALIDRIASALGPEATPERVERVARAVLDARPSGEAGRAPGPLPPPASGAPGPAEGAARVVVTAYGQDRPGVLAAITAELSASGANILDVSQKVLQGYFTVVLVADLAADADLGAVRDALVARGEAMGTRVLLQHEELFQAMHRP
ncbi:ACT domain-containing protein [Rubrivirga sp.]|uniref:ACT domain-containing protein n=1 Tax=Rubrivirga sp. TaxID=1885344 RepID=UPI003B52F443